MKWEQKRGCKKMLVKKSGFTLIELVMVIIILGILAAITLPKFANFKTRAIERSEDSIAGAINTALKIYQTSYIVTGGDPSTYPAVNPFTLLEQGPRYAGPTDPLVPDGVNWRYYHETGVAYYVHCPHRNGPPYAVGGNKGRWYIYQYGPAAGYGWGHNIGDFWLKDDQGHTY